MGVSVFHVYTYVHVCLCEREDSGVCCLLSDLLSDFMNNATFSKGPFKKYVRSIN